MKLFLGVVLAFSYLNTFAKTVNLEMKATFKKGNETKVQSLKLKADLDTIVTLPTDEKNPLKFELRPTENFDELPKSIDKKNVVYISANVYVKDKKGETLVASPKLLVKYGEKATFLTENENGESFELEVLPTVIK